MRAWHGWRKLGGGLLLGLAVCGGTARAATFYVDADAGKDSNAGAEPAQAWATLGPVNAHIFQPGDRILFHAGQSWTGELEPHGNGTREDPILISRYGDGAKPLFTGDGGDATLALRSVSGWTVQDIAVTNHGAAPAPERVGVLIHTNTYSYAIHLVRVDVSDVNGEVDSKSSGGIGLYAWDKSKEAGKGELARFDDVLIDHCTVMHVDGEGIFSYVKNEGHTYPDTNVRLTGTTIMDTGRNAVYMRGTLGGMIDHNTIKDSSMRKHGNALCVGWAKNTVVRGNEVSETGIHTGEHENGAIDVDDGAIGTLVEFNWTHDNVGGSVNAAAQPGMDGDDSDTVIRYNVSENDGAHAFGVGGAITNTQIYNNTVYVGKGRTEQIVTAGQYTHYPQLPQWILFARNVIYNEGLASFTWKANQVAIESNCYLGKTPQDPPKDAHMVKDKSVHLEGPMRTRSDAAKYRVPAASACAGATTPLPDVGKADFLGTEINGENVNLRGAVLPMAKE